MKAQPPRATLASVLADAGGATAEEMEDADEDAGALGAEDDDGGISDWSPPRERLVGAR